MAETTHTQKRERLERERDAWAAIGGGNPHMLALAAQAAIDALDAEECPMCGWTPGTNPDNCAQCKIDSHPVFARFTQSARDTIARNAADKEESC